MANIGGNTGQPSEDPSKRSKVSPSIFGQILDALVNFTKDVEKGIIGIKFQDRGGASPMSTDILTMNSQMTPPAALQTNIPENSELRNSHQNNEKQFRFIKIGTLNTLSNQPVPLASGHREGNHIPIFKDKFTPFSQLIGLHGYGYGPGIAGKPGSQIAGKKILDTAQTTPAGSGSGGAPASAPSGGGGAPGSHGFRTALL